MIAFCTVELEYPSINSDLFWIPVHLLWFILNWNINVDTVGEYLINLLNTMDRSQKSVTLDFSKNDKKTDRLDFDRGYLLID